MRRRILLAIGGTLLAMLIIISVASRAILLDSYEGLESRYLERDVQRVLGDIVRQEAGLGRAVGDNAAWSAMYKFVLHPSSAFADAKITPESIANLRVDIVMVLNNEGTGVYGRAFGKGAAKPGIVESLSAWIAAHHSRVLIPDKTGTAQGIIRLSQGLLLLATRPILDDLRSLPVAGTLVMGRLFDEAAVAEMAKQLLITVSVHGMGDAAASELVRRAKPLLTEEHPLSIDTTRDRTASVFALLHDMDDVPVAIVQVDSPRDIRQQGVRTTRYFFLWLLFIGAGFCGVALLTLERTVLSRLVHLGKSILAIGTGGDSARRISIGGTDQIAYIGAAVNGMLDTLARSTEQLRDSERRNAAFLDAVPDTIFRVTRDGTILDARSSHIETLLETAGNLVGKDSEQLLPLFSFISPELFDKSLSATAAALNTGVTQTLSFSVDTEAGKRYFEERFVAANDNEVIALVREVTDIRNAEEARRRGILLKEIHHRVKNNLQVISSLLALQAGAAKDPVTRTLLRESRDRVRSMGLIHEKLYLSEGERGMSFSAYVGDLAAHLRRSYTGSSEAITMELDVQDIVLDMDASVPCGLIINELLSNALKHAYVEEQAGTIRMRMREEPKGTVELTVSDDGKGLPPGFDIGSTHTLGLRIVGSLVAQLKGTISAGPGPGASFTITFPLA
jgi:two-component sensor histidine kinase/sensor domain CHASE-containing protein